MNKTILTLTILGLTLSAWNTALAAANDNFADRIVFTETNITVMGSNTGASKEAGEPDHAGNPGGKSLWWSWTAPTNGEVNLNTDGSDFDTLLAVYTGSSLAALSLVASNDDHGLFVTSRVRFEAVQGAQYQIGVDGYNDGTNLESGQIMMGLIFVSEPIARPANDNFASRISLSGVPLTTIGSNVEATRESGEPVHAGKFGDASVWWSWTAPVTAIVRVSTADSAFDTLLAVYKGSSVSSLVEVASGDDQNSSAGILTSVATFSATAGDAYQIAVDGFDGASGRISLHFDVVDTSLSAPARLGDGTFQFTLKGLAGGTYQIDATASFSGWTNIATLVNTNGTMMFVDPAAANFNQRVYRAFLKP